MNTLHYTIDMKPVSEKTALLLLNMQNDFIRDDGAMARGNRHIPETRSLTERLIRVTQIVQNLPRHSIISCQFTLIADKDNHPVFPDLIKRTFPFLGRGDFHAQRTGHQLIKELQPADYSVNTIAYSAFYRTHLDWLLKSLGIRNLLIAGVPTDTAILSTVRDAQINNYTATVLTDGCAAFESSQHTETIRSLGHLCPLRSCKEYAEEVRFLTTAEG